MVSLFSERQCSKSQGNTNIMNNSNNNNNNNSENKKNYNKMYYMDIINREINVEIDNNINIINSINKNNKNMNNKTNRNDKNNKNTENNGSNTNNNNKPNKNYKKISNTIYNTNTNYNNELSEKLEDKPYPTRNRFSCHGADSTKPSRSKNARSSHHSKHEHGKEKRSCSHKHREKPEELVLEAKSHNSHSDNSSKKKTSRVYDNETVEHRRKKLLKSSKRLSDALASFYEAFKDKHNYKDFFKGYDFEFPSSYSTIYNKKSDTPRVSVTVCHARKKDEVPQKTSKQGSVESSESKKKKILKASEVAPKNNQNNFDEPKLFEESDRTYDQTNDQTSNVEDTMADKTTDNYTSNFDTSYYPSPTQTTTTTTEFVENTYETFGKESKGTSMSKKKKSKLNKLRLQAQTVLDMDEKIKGIQARQNILNNNHCCFENLLNGCIYPTCLLGSKATKNSQCTTPSSKKTMKTGQEDDMDEICNIVNEIKKCCNCQ